MRENRTCGSEGGEAQSLPYPYPALPTTSRGYYLWCFGYLLFEEDEVFFFKAAEEGL